jgi:hypothetical protein
MPGLSASAVARYARAGLPAAAIAAVARLLAAGASRPAAELTASPPPRSAGRPAAAPARPGRADPLAGGRGYLRCRTTRTRCPA